MGIKDLVHKIILVSMFAFLSSPAAFAVSSFENLLLNHPGKFAFIIFAAGAVIAGLFIGIFYLSQLRKTRKKGKVIAKVESEKENKQARRKQIPYGPVEGVSLPLARLIWESARGTHIKPSNHILSTKEEFHIGRSEYNHLQLTDAVVSRRHAKIRPEREGYVLYDMLSSHGTIVNGSKIDKCILKDRDTIKIGTNYFAFQQEKE